MAGMRRTKPTEFLYYCRRVHLYLYREGLEPTEMTWLRLRDLYLDKIAPRKAADIEIEILSTHEPGCIPAPEDDDE